MLCLNFETVTLREHFPETGEDLHVK